MPSYTCTCTIYVYGNLVAIYEAKTLICISIASKYAQGYIYRESVKRMYSWSPGRKKAFKLPSGRWAFLFSTTR